MASSETEICNSALIKVGAKRIVSLTENSPEARICQEQYEKVRDDLLRSHPWNFAIKRTRLAAVTPGPDFGYSNKFLVPSDCLRVLTIGEYPSTLEWRKEENYILANESTLPIEYVARITDVSKFDANFVEVLALKIAYDISYALTQSTTLKELLRQDYTLALRDARTFDAQESSTRQVYARDYANVRY